MRGHITVDSDGSEVMTGVGICLETAPLSSFPQLRKKKKNIKQKETDCWLITTANWFSYCRL